MQTIIENYLLNLQECVKKTNKAEIETFIKILKKARDNGSHIFVMGNGGSASTASHLCCELNKGASYNKNKRFKDIRFLIEEEKWKN